MCDLESVALVVHVYIVDELCAGGGEAEGEGRPQVQPVQGEGGGTWDRDSFQGSAGPRSPL